MLRSMMLRNLLLLVHLLCHASFSEAQVEKVVSLHGHHRKRGSLAWTHRQIHDILKQVDLSSSYATTTSNYVPALYILDFNSRVSAIPSASSAVTKTPFLENEWMFLVHKGFNRTGTDPYNLELFTKNEHVAKSRENALTNATRGRKNDSLLKRFVDDFNFKGFGVSFYKSLLYLRTAGVAFRVPLINNWDWWDSNPALPSLGLMLCVYYPLNLSVCLTSSIDINVLKFWSAKFLFLVQACILRFIHHMLSAIWTLASVFLYPFFHKWLQVPLHFDRAASQVLGRRQRMQNPSYKSGIQERLGMSYWYRWRPDIGFDTRVSFWHLYMPTLEAYSQLLFGSKDRLGQWWRSHFSSLGLDTAVPNPVPPHVSLTGVLSLNGFRFLSQQKVQKSSKHSEGRIKTISTSGRQETDNTVATTKTRLSSILHQNDVEEIKGRDMDSLLLESIVRGGNTTSS